MTRDEPDRLFERFRDEGDLGALGALFDASSEDLMRVAQRVGFRGADAEDLVQATFLIAIEKVRGWNGQGAVTAWLAGILAKEAQNWRRRMRRQPDVRTVSAAPAAREERERPVRSLVDGETRANVARAIASLPALYREVLERHLVDEESPSEIAAATAIPPGTVRVRLHRGLARLRERLPSGAAIAIPAALPERGLAAVRAELLTHAHTLPTLGAAATATATGGFLLPSIAMTKRAALLVFLALGTVFGARTLSGFRGGPDRDVSEPPPRIVRAPDAPPLDASSSAWDAEREGAAARDVIDVAGGASADAPSGRPDIVVHTVFADGSPAPHVHLKLQPLRVGIEPLECNTGESGTCTIRPTSDDVYTEKYVAYPNRGGSRVIDLDGNLQNAAEAPALTLRIELPAGTDVQGRVLDANGQPVADAEVWVTSELHRSEYRVAARTESDGRYTLRQLGDACMFGARKEGHAPSSPLLVETLRERADQTHSLTADLVLPGRGATLSGTVRDADGRAAEGARVRVGSQSRFEVMGPDGPEGPPPPVELVTDESGRFRYAGAASGDVDWAVCASGHAIRTGSVVVDAGANETVEIDLERGARVEGRILDGEGEPVPNASITVRESAFDMPGIASSFPPLGLRVDRDGRFSIPHLAPGGIHLTARTVDGQGEARWSVLVVDGDVKTWEPRIETVPRLRGVARHADGRPMPGARVLARAMERSGSSSRFDTSDNEGRFEIAGLPKGEVRLILYAPSAEGSVARDRAAPIAVLDGVDARAQDVRLVATADQAPRGVLVATLVPIDAELVWTVLCFDLGWWDERRTAAGGTELQYEGLPQGDFVVRARAEGYASIELEVKILGAGELRDLGEIRLEPEARLDVWLEGTEGPLRQAMVNVYGSDGEIASNSMHGAHAEIEGLEAGIYSVVAIAEGHGQVVKEVTLAVGEPRRLDLTLRPGTSFGVEIVDPSDGPVGCAAQVRVTARNGDVVCNERVTPHAGHLVHWTLAPFDELTVEVTTEDGRTGRATATHKGEVDRPLLVRVR